MKKTVLSSLLVFSLMFSQVQANESSSARLFSVGVKTGLMLLGVVPVTLFGMRFVFKGREYLEDLCNRRRWSEMEDFIGDRESFIIGSGVVLAMISGLYGWNNMSEFELAKGAYRYRDPSAHPDSFFQKLIVWENGGGVDYSLDDLRQIRDGVRNGESIPSELVALSDVHGGGENFLSVLREEIEVVENLLKHQDRVAYWRRLPLLGFFTRRIQAFIAKALKSGDALRRIDEYHAYLCYMEEIFA